MVFPGNEHAVFVRTTTDINPSRRAEVRPGELFLSCPDKFYWLADGLCQTRRFHCAFSAVFAAISAAHVRHDDADVLCGNAECGGQFIADGKWALCACPDSGPVSIPFGDGSARFQRSMSNILHRVMLLELYFRRGHRLLNRARHVRLWGPSVLRMV